MSTCADESEGKYERFLGRAAKKGTKLTKSHRIYHEENTFFDKTNYRKI